MTHKRQTRRSWDSIIDEANAKYPGSFRFDSAAGGIYEWSTDANAYIYIGSTVSLDKCDFMEEYC